MKLIKTYNGPAQDGYFDPQTRCVYRVESPARKPPEPHMFRVAVSEGEHLYQFLSPLYPTREEALTELDRIAALIEGKAPAQGWVAGAPPCIPDARFLVADCEGDFSVVRWMPENPHGEWVYGPEDEISYPNGSITHHLPTPIVIP